MILSIPPPNYEDIIKVLPKAIFENGTIFTYAPNIHYIGNLPADLIAHESVHIAQQGSDPVAWWERYLSDESFRYGQEIEAYHEQYQYAKKHYGPENSFKILRRITDDLSGPLYGNIVGYKQCMDDIKSGTIKT